MEKQFVTEQLRTKWAPVLEHADMPAISDDYRKNVTAILLENQEQYLKEAAPTNSGLATGTENTFNTVNAFDPVLISLVRRAMPNLMAYDVCGVQPMNAPTGLIFAMKAKYLSQTGNEALFNEADTSFGATAYGPGNSQSNPATSDPLLIVDSTNFAGNYGSSAGMSTALGEALGDSDANPFSEMAFVIDRQSVTARTRALKAEYTTELAQDLKAVHGLDAETELANILSTEILSEINREVIRTIYKGAKLGAQQPDLAHKGAGTTTEALNAIGADAMSAGLSGTYLNDGLAANTGSGLGVGGVYDLEADSDGRWSAERFRGLVYQIEREANTIAKETRRGKGNILITTSDVASALAMSGFLNLTPTPQVPGFADDTANTFVGTLNGNIKVFVDPYSQVGKDYCCVGYRGSSPYDAGMFYCPYVPLQMVRAVGENSFQPKIGFKTRYGLVNNPFVSQPDPSADGAIRENQYYRIFRVDKLHGAVSAY